MGAAINDMLNAFSDVASSPADLTARSVALTRDGAMLAEVARRVTGELAEVTLALRAEAQLQKGLVTVVAKRMLLEQALANGAAIVWSFVLTYGIMVLLKKTIGVRVSEESEAAGLDLAEHGETAYNN